ncbi:MAG: hypothetical protein PHE97_04180 [Candidatus Omnitrophica bacterium]|nr:hypothetical protein [Candidatus Omnitrophota bacterium]
MKLTGKNMEKTNRKIKTQSILEYLIMLTGVVAAIMLSTQGFKLGLRGGLNRAQNDINSTLRQNAVFTTTN